VEVSPVDAREAGTIERAVAAFARSPNGGLIVTSTRFAVLHRDLIITLAARHRLPAVYPYRHYVTSGGLISYGPDQVDQFRRAASYVDRILKGEKPADLPVQAPVKYELVLNLKTAKALGLDMPPTVLARADEVIDKVRRAFCGTSVAAPAHRRLCAMCRFSDAGDDELAARCGGRRPKSAKARNRGGRLGRPCRTLSYGDLSGERAACVRARGER
jgi:hypothetical protein